MNNDAPIVEVPRATDNPCTECGFSNVMTVSMSIQGTDVVVRLCLDCDERTWNRDGKHVSLESLFGTMRTTSKRP
jgi:DNA polymerase III alpha subunit (gram-positive type)